MELPSFRLGIELRNPNRDKTDRGRDQSRSPCWLAPLISRSNPELSPEPFQPLCPGEEPVHIPYGRFDLDLDERIEIERSAA